MDQQRLKKQIARPKPIMQEEKPVFKIPKIQFQKPFAEQPAQSPGVETGPEPEPEKKKSWKTWLIIILVLFIAAGLGYYFLKS
jgi:hypothetical protein